MTSRRGPAAWYARESFWRDFHDVMFTPERLEAADGEIEGLLALARPRGRDALDHCCGPGRLSLALAQRGFQVTGVDRSRFLLALARRRLAGCRPRPELVRQDMRDFERPRAFDLAVNLYTSFGYFEDPADDLLVLRRLHASLRPGGVLVIDTIGKERLAAVFAPVSTDFLPDGGLFVQRREIVRDWTRIRNEWILVKDGVERRHAFEHTLFSGRELRSLMEAAGFRRVELYGDLSGAPYDRQARRLVAVGRRSDAPAARARRQGPPA